MFNLKKNEEKLEKEELHERILSLEWSKNILEDAIKELQLKIKQMNCCHSKLIFVEPENFSSFYEWRVVCDNCGEIVKEFVLQADWLKYRIEYESNNLIRRSTEHKEFLQHLKDTLKELEK